jgi:hypothetical protein
MGCAGVDSHLVPGDGLLLTTTVAVALLLGSAWLVAVTVKAPSVSGAV